MNRERWKLKVKKEDDKKNKASMHLIYKENNKELNEIKKTMKEEKILKLLKLFSSYLFSKQFSPGRFNL